jgi:hypothetical protein
MSPRLLRPKAAGGFTPKSLAGLVGWWDAADSSTITVATGVSDWRDKSGVGSGKTLLQTTANNQPTLSTLKGKGALSFDGSNDRLVTSGNVTLVGEGAVWTVFSVIQSDGTGAMLNQDDFSSPRPPQFQRIWTGTSPTKTARVFVQNAAGTATGAISQGVIANGVACVVSTRQSSDTSDIWVNGANNGTASLSPNTTRFSKVVEVGSIGAASFFTGFIGEIVVYERALTTSERQTVERYLGKKWSITVA